jgi:hypothetical protein
MILVKKNKTLNIVLGAKGVFISFLLILFFNDIVKFLFITGEKYLSEDNQVNPESIWLVKTATVGLIAFILLLSFLFFIDFYSRALRRFGDLFDLRKLHLFFIEDKLAINEKLSKVTLIAATGTAVLYHLFFLFFGEIKHEGYIEEISSLFLFISSFILILGLKFLNKEYFSLFWYRTHQYTLIFLSLMLFILFGEEINWGQRVLEIESGEFFKTYNFQDEISFHNFFNPLFKFVYPAVAMSSFVILILLWLFYKGEKNYYFNVFVPHKSLFFLIFWMAGASFNGESETYEEMLTIFFFLYSIRILFCLKNLKKTYNFEFIIRNSPKPLIESLYFNHAG